MARRWRVYEPEAASRSGGGELELSAEESHHLRRVLRLAAGDSLWIFDGAGSEWEARIVNLGASRAVVRLEAPVTTGRVDPALPVTLYQGLARSDRMEWVLQKSTELGVAALHPWVTALSETRVPGAQRRRRWERILVEACKQSGRRCLPTLAVVDALPPPEPGEVALLLDTESGSTPLAERLRGPVPERVALAVGPESGLQAAERERFGALGWRSVGLGPRTLRTETAGIVAVGLILHAWGDLGSLDDPGRGV